ncbi:MAG: SCO family protein [Sphingomonadales bacterium 32-68-7]|nr:MAG: SCO family protein [Sphingomonadales bacterium 12-68-11]OYX08341.1 MAG: SCO family protein [Sphingomonadales bacterium 32-68-7]
MNGAAMPAPVRCLAAGFALALLAACGSSVSPPAGDPPLAGAAIGGPFELVDSTGKTVRWSDFDGKYRIVYFGYTYCPDVCPYDVQRMMAGFAQFKRAHPDRAAQVQPLFVSIDPERDTPAVVGEFSSAFSDDLLGLTGTPAQVDQAAKAFKAFYAKGQDAGNGSYLMDHSRAAYLMGRNGEPIALLPVETADKGEAVAAELAKWVS